MTWQTIKHMVERIYATNYLYFTEDELNVIYYNKLLYIIVRCKDWFIGKVLVDNSLDLNMITKQELDEMITDLLYMLPSIMMVRAYNGSPRQVVGTIEVKLFMDSQALLVTL